MLKRTDDAAEFVALANLGVLRIAGADTERFLQGQLSNDMQQLPSGRTQLTGYHNPQGRAIAVLHLVRSAPDAVLAVLPRELAANVAQRLTKFILRAKVKIEDLSEKWRVDGLIGPTASPAPSEPGLLVRYGADAERWLHIRPAADGAHARAEPHRWRALAIERGEPQVYAATSEEFVAQMLNLDVLGAIGFEKGCYTGQEVIARAHYRGRVKRRMQRFRTLSTRELSPGSVGRLADGPAFKVVDAVRTEDGACEFLAVAALEVRDEAQAAEDGAPIEASALPLPYALPE
jgi:folate-binding protein YgfZ